MPSVIEDLKPEQIAKLCNVVILQRLPELPVCPVEAIRVLAAKAGVALDGCENPECDHPRCYGLAEIVMPRSSVLQAIRRIEEHTGCANEVEE